MFRSITRFIVTGVIIKCLLLALLVFYRYVISPWLGPRCRFYPTCSVYAQEALREYPLHRALILIFKRIIRCHPYCQGGVDPLPCMQLEKKEK